MSVIGDALRKAENDDPNVQREVGNTPPPASLEYDGDERRAANVPTMTPRQLRMSVALVAVVACVLSAIALRGSLQGSLHRWLSNGATVSLGQQQSATASHDATSADAPLHAEMNGSVSLPRAQFLSGDTESVEPATLTLQDLLRNEAPDVRAQLGQKDITPTAPRRDISRDYRLEGIMVGGRSRLAVINGSIVQEGQRFGDAVIREITEAGVTVEVDGESYGLLLGGVR